MATIDTPQVETGQVETHEGVLKWFRRGLCIFLFLIIMALVIRFPLPEPVRDWDGPEEQPPVETPVSESSSEADVTVTATPDYHGSN